MTKTNHWLLSAAVLILLASFVHTIGGELTTIDGLLGSDTPREFKLELRLGWYMAALDMGVTGVFLVVLLRKDRVEENRLFVGFCALRFMLYGAVALALMVPQSVLLLVIGLLLWQGNGRTLLGPPVKGEAESGAKEGEA